MQVEQRTFTLKSGWQCAAGKLAAGAAQLVLVFGDRELLASGEALAALRQLYPHARLAIASTSGEIAGTEVLLQQVSATAIHFSRTQIRCAVLPVSGVGESRQAGHQLAEMLQGPDLAHVFVLSDGQQVNGAELAHGFNERLPAHVRLTGGLAGDGARFERTLVGLDGPPSPQMIVAVGFYGQHLEIGFGCAGGWEAFGPERVVTKSTSNILHELDGRAALHLYKEYLGDQAAELPGAALRFPLSVLEPGANEAVVRTILSLDDATGTMTFAGDIAEGSRVWLMRASYEDLIGGAERAAEQARRPAAPDLAICVSCVGRRIVLGQRTEEETESVRAVLGDHAVITGFYSNGELAPSRETVACRLHNQTMTVTTFREVAG